MIINKLIDIFEKETGKKDVLINKESVLRKDLKINSYDFVQVICEIEDEFNIEIPDKDMAHLITVGDVINYIESKI